MLNCAVHGCLLLCFRRRPLWFNHQQIPVRALFFDPAGGGDIALNVGVTTLRYCDSPVGGNSFPWPESSGDHMKDDLKNDVVATLHRNSEVHAMLRTMEFDSDLD
jgi:hypothetical protein